MFDGEWGKRNDDASAAYVGAAVAAGVGTGTPPTASFPAALSLVAPRPGAPSSYDDAAQLELPAAAGPDVDDLAAWLDQLGRLADRSGPELSEQQCIELIRGLEDLKAAAAGAQAVLTARFAESRKAAEAARGIPAYQRGKGLASEVALARRVSPHRGGQHLGLAMVLVEDMPHTLSLLRTGQLSEWRATLIVRESICLPRAQRQALDAELCADPADLDGVGDARLAAKAKQIAYRLEPHSVVDRAARAEKERCVTVRPAPDTMAYVTALLPVAQAVAVQVALARAADSARAAGDGRSRGQLMADTLVDRITGAHPADGVPVHVQLVMTDHALLGGGHEPAHLPGYGPMPAQWARELISTALRHGAGAWLRRLFTDPAGHLVAMDARSRTAPAGLARFITIRDGGTCRTPWCDAPIRHIDHIRPHADGGATAEANLQGLCERCNYARAVSGWHSTLSPGPSPGRSAPTVITTTPTGHSYTSPPRRLPRVG